MEALLLRMAPGDSEAETALRIIAYFDRLVEHAGDMGDLLRSAARLVRAPAGYFDLSGRWTMSYAASGRAVPAQMPNDAPTKHLSSDLGPAGHLWLGPEADARVQALVLERMAIAAVVILGRAGSFITPSTSSWVPQLLEHDLGKDDREDAARGLGLHVHAPARVVVMTGGDGAAALTDYIRSWCVSSTDAYLPCVDHDGMSITVVQTSAPKMPANAPKGGLVAAGASVPVVGLPASLKTALVALRLTSSWLGPHLMAYDELGPLRHIAEVDPAVAAETPEVAQLMYLSETATGIASIKALDSFCRHGNLRSAATELHLHHSSLAHRLSTVAARLHLPLDGPDGRFRAQLALHLYRVAGWAPRPTAVAPWTPSRAPAA